MWECTFCAINSSPLIRQGSPLLTLDICFFSVFLFSIFQLVDFLTFVGVSHFPHVGLILHCDRLKELLIVPPTVS